MSIHYLNPDDEPRECERCKGAGYKNDRLIVLDDLESLCNGCGGTGRLGNVDGPRIFTSRSPDFADDHPMESGWYFGPDVEVGPVFGPYSTESAALDAARAAHREASR